MNLSSQYYSYCKEIGVLKEVYSRQRGLDLMKESVAKAKAVDPKFVEEFNKVTLTSPCTSFRVCMLYKWDIELDYVVNGNIKHGRITDFGESKKSVYEDLHITNFGETASYTKLNDFSSIPYTLYNDKNVFTYEQMKSALKGVINNQVPRGTTSYKSTNWSISCYAVPVLVVRFEYKGKIYNMCYNLVNGHYHYEWENDPALYEKGKKAKKVSKLIKIGSFVGNILAFILAIAVSGSALAIVASIAAFIIQIIVTKNKSKSKSYFENFFINNPKKKLSACIKFTYVNVVIAVIAIIVAVVL